MKAHRYSLYKASPQRTERGRGGRCLQSLQVSFPYLEQQRSKRELQAAGGSLGPPHEEVLPPVDLLLELEDSIEEGLGGGGATGHVDVNGDDPVAAADHRIGVVVVPTAIGAAAHGDHPAGLRHLVVDPAGGEERREAPDDDDDDDVLADQKKKNLHQEFSFLSKDPKTVKKKVKTGLVWF